MPARLLPRAARLFAAAPALLLTLLVMTAGRPAAAKAAQSILLNVEITSAPKDRDLAGEVSFLLREGLLGVEDVSVLSRRVEGGPSPASISGRLSRDGSFVASLTPGGSGSPPAPVSGRFDALSPFDGADGIYGSLLPGLRGVFPTTPWPPSLSYPTSSTEALRLYVMGLEAVDEADRLVFLTQSAAADPSFAAPLVERGRVFLAAGAIDAAMDDFRLALDFRPGHREAHAGLGAAYRRRGDTGVAESHFREALRTDPLYVEAKRSLDEMLGKGSSRPRRDPPPAEGDELPAHDGGGGRGGEGTGKPARRDRPVEREKKAAGAENTRRQLDDIELEMELFLSVGMDKEAAEARRRRDELMEESALLRQEERSAGKAAPAVAEDVPPTGADDRAEEEVSPAEDFAGDYRRRGEDAMSRGATEEAVELFEAYLSAGGGNPDTIYSLAEIYLRLGKYARARELFAAAARSYGDMKKKD